MIDAPKIDNFKAFKEGGNFVNDDISIDDETGNDLSGPSYEQLKQYEQQWWQARQRFINLKERQMFWFGDNSIITWLLWQLVSYVIVAIVMMTLGKLFNIPMSLWHYTIVFGIQTMVFIIALIFKGQLANYIQEHINDADTMCEQALTKMADLASENIFPYVHDQAPISLQTIYTHYKAQLRLATLQRLLQKEIDAGRLILDQHQIEAEILPPEFVDDELTPYASEMVYKSLITYSS
ncbi:hypothetical protein [uncultured Psychrobacter sp.]|uniref:hypothetical protein n=1 Tax=uncultured Psychrobacter sp. TaxID=259303 RepID=UPI00345A9705